MKKKIWSILLASAMAAGCLTGCGSTTESTVATNSDSNEAASSEVTEIAAASEDAIQNLIDATTDTVSLTVWASEEDQEFTQGLIDSFEALYPDVTFDIQLGAESEADAKDDILTDVEAGPDVYAFADDQINELVNAGALQEVTATYTYDVVNENLSGAVEAASMNGNLYAYPMTADNGYFLYYDSTVFSEEDVESLDKMIEVAEAAGKKIGMIVSDAWYNYSFFAGAGYDVTLNDDGLTNSCNWNADGATDVAQAIIDLGQTGVFINVADDAAIMTGVNEGTYAAVVSGVWNADAIYEAWGDGYAATKLPTYTVAGEQVQMSSFSGYKLIGVNPHSSYAGWAMLLAEYLTNEENQIARFETRGLGPANANAAASDAVQASPAIAALAAQAEYAVPQRVGANYWSPANTLGSTLINGNPDGTDLQTLLDNAVDGITAAVE
jgi:arabinogalactan oligomer/maltooligosaccharide transport system substrate-binding protein